MNANAIANEMRVNADVLFACTCLCCTGRVSFIVYISAITMLPRMRANADALIVCIYAFITGAYTLQSTVGQAPAKTIIGRREIKAPQESVPGQYV